MNDKQTTDELNMSTLLIRLNAVVFFKFLAFSISREFDVCKPNFKKIRVNFV